MTQRAGGFTPTSSKTVRENKLFVWSPGGGIEDELSDASSSLAHSSINRPQAQTPSVSLPFCPVGGQKSSEKEQGFWEKHPHGAKMPPKANSRDCFRT